MRIAALSDFHIGATERTDGFRHREADFLRYLDRLERDHDMIVLLGDVFQTQQGWRHDRAALARELERAIARVPSLWRRLSSPGYRYIHGNHDAVAAAELGALESLRLADDGFAVFLIHGHQFDPVLGAIRPIADAGTWVSGRLRAAGLGAIADRLEHADIAVKHRRFRGPDGPYARAARELLDVHRADAVLMGHTHIGARVELGDRVYANTGSCSMGALSHISIDTAAREVELVRTPRPGSKTY